jgi:colicin import membrane protein
MHATADRLDFAPPPQPGLARAFGLAVAAHLLLVAALMHGLQWKTDPQSTVAEAELWSSLPQQAAPREVVPPPPPPPPPAPVVQAPPPPPPVVKEAPRPEPPVQRQPDIALEREKQRRERELERRELERRERELEKREQEKQRQAELAREREQKRKLEAQKQREEEIARKKEEQARAVAEAKRKEAEERKRKEQEAREAARLAKQREENIKRSLGMAGTGAPDSTGTAARSSGPSASWGASVQARVRPNIVFGDDAPGNPEAVVEVRLAPDGTIVSRRIKKGSGNKAWDEAVLRALDRTQVLPRDTDGRVPPRGDLVFRPRG